MSKAIKPKKALLWSIIFLLVYGSEFFTVSFGLDNGCAENVLLAVCKPTVVAAEAFAVLTPP